MLSSGFDIRSSRPSRRLSSPLSSRPSSRPPVRPPGASQASSKSMRPWQLLGKQASAALLAEVRLTPKPALVDERGSGAHQDLTLASMTRSALALEPFFQEMARLAYGAQVNTLLREALAECGRQAELAMRRATGGSNSHRGAIWCLGLLVAAAAMHDTTVSAFDIAATAGQLSVLPDHGAPEMDTHGLAVQRIYGAVGARVEAESGFPHVTDIGLPQLRARRLAGVPETSCRLDALLAIMSSLNDTCLLYRGGLKALKTAQNGAQEVLDLGGTDNPDGMDRLFQLDRDLIALNASPGGSADLLAGTLFLDILDSTVENPNRLILNSLVKNGLVRNGVNRGNQEG